MAPKIAVTGRVTRTWVRHPLETRSEATLQSARAFGPKRRCRAEKVFDPPVE